MNVWEFLTSDTAPWWSALLGTVIGGVITWLISRSTMKAQASIEKQRLNAELEHQERDKWRAELLDAVSDLLAVHHEYVDSVNEARIQIRREIGDPDDHQSFDAMWDDPDLFSKFDAKLNPLNSRIDLLSTKIMILSNGDISQAATKLAKADRKFKPWDEREQFYKSEEDAEFAAALLTTSASVGLSYDLDEPSGFVSSADENLRNMYRSKRQSSD